MKKIALTAVAVLALTGGAFAGSDHYGSQDVQHLPTAVDSGYTASISNKGPAQDNSQTNTVNQIQPQFRH